ncbi:MAG: VWA domain-containing protein [Elusimicrobia bacterium]|nr:VWA domain-containing protein [Elusimicrobiota bacterium]
MFKYPAFLWALLPALTAAGLSYFQGEKRRARISRALGDSRTLERLASLGRGPRRLLKFWLKFWALAFLGLGLAGPQWGLELVSAESDARQVLIAVDVSQSMLAEDFKPSRLEKAKRELALLLDQLPGSRVGIIAFAGEPALVCPLTTDLEAAKQILSSLSPDMVPVPGTGIGKAIKLASQSLERYSGEKSLVLITDGEDHRTDPLKAAREALAQSMRIFPIGIGSPEGEPIPIKEGGNLSGYKKDKNGRTVISKLGEGALSAIAAETRGRYYRATAGESEAALIAEEILKAGKAKGAASSMARYKNRFAVPLGLALALLMLEFLIPELQKKKTLLPVVLLLTGALHSPLHAALGAEGSLRRGNKLYRKELYAPALKEYEEAGRRKPRDPRPFFNAGDALYHLGEYGKAQEAFAALAESAAPAPLRGQAYYNLGNMHMAQGQYPQAVEAYRNALGLASKDPDLRHNLALALRYLKNPPPQKKQKDQGKENPQNQPSQSPNSQDRQQPEKSKPQPPISREDAERLLRAVAEKEKSAPQLKREKAAKRPPSEPEEDW